MQRLPGPVHSRGTPPNVVESDPVIWVRLATVYASGLRAALTALRGHIAVGHCRYSTTCASVWANAQPTFRSTPTTSLALGHNGNLINTRELAVLLGETGQGSGESSRPPTPTCSSRCSSAAACRPASAGGPVGASAGAPAADPAGDPAGVEGAAAAVLPLAKGVYSLVFMDEQTLDAARDPHGFRPLVLCPP